MKKIVAILFLYFNLIWPLAAQNTNYNPGFVGFSNAWVSDYDRANFWNGGLTSGIFTANPEVSNGYFTLDIYVDRPTQWVSDYSLKEGSISDYANLKDVSYNNALGGFTVCFRGSFYERFEVEGSGFVLSPEVDVHGVIPPDDVRSIINGYDSIVSPVELQNFELNPSNLMIGFAKRNAIARAASPTGKGTCPAYVVIEDNTPLKVGTLRLKIKNPTLKTDMYLEAINCDARMYATDEAKLDYGVNAKRVGWLDVDPNGFPLGEVEVKPDAPEIIGGETEICLNSAGVYKLKNFPPNADTVIWVVTKGAPLASTSPAAVTDAKISNVYAKGDSAKVIFYTKDLYYINAYSVLGEKRSDTVTYAQTINVLEAPTLTLTSSAGTSEVCSGSSVTLTATGVADGQYKWEDDASITQGVRTVNPLTTKTYTVSASNGGCTTTEHKEVKVKALPVVAVTPHGNQTLCEGESIQFTASGATTYKWSWTGGSATGSTLKAKPTINTNYTVTGEEGECTSKPVTVQVEVAKRPNIAWEIAPPAQVTVNDPFTVKAAASGTLGTYFYYWLQPNDLNDGNDHPQEQKFVAGPHDYYFAVYAEDANTCRTDTLRDTVSVFVPQVHVEADSMYAFCEGGANILKTKILPGESQGPYAYKWYLSGNESNPLGWQEQLYVESAGVYVVKVTDSSPTPLVGYDTVHLTSMKSFNLQLSVDSPLRIAPNSRTLLTVEATGETPNSWHWGPEIGFDDAAEAQKQYPLTALLSATQKYGVYALSADGCMSKTDTVVVNVDNVNGIRVLASANTRKTCKGGDILLNANVEGGSGVVNYSWTPTANLSSAGSKNPVFSCSTAGNYTFRVKVTRGTGTAIASIDVAVEDLEAPVLALSKDPNKSCVGDTIKLTNSGAQGVIKWFREGTELSGSEFWNLIGLQGVYSATVKTSQGCEDTVKMEIIPDLQPALVWNPALSKKVVNGTVINPTVKASGGTASSASDYTITWTSPTSYVGNPYPTVTADYAVGQYEFKVSAVDKKGCKSNVLEETVNVVPPSLDVYIEAAYRYCKGGADTLRLLQPVTGGQAPYQYKWYVSGSPDDPKAQGQSATEFAMKHADYGDDIWIVLEVSDASATTIYGRDTVKLSTGSYTAPVISAGPNQTVKQNSTAILLGEVVSGTPTGWNWTPAIELADGEAQKQYAQTTPRINPQTYTVVATDANRCLSVGASTLVNVESGANALWVDASPAVSTVCLKNTVKLQTQVSGNTNSLQYTWLAVPNTAADISQLDHSNVANPIFSAKSVGTQEYIVKVTEEVTNRTATAKVKITVNSGQSPILSFADASKSCEGDTLMVQTSGVSATDFQWYVDGVLQPASAHPTIYVINTTGQHTFKVTARNGACAADTISTTVDIHERPTLPIWEAAPPATVELNNSLTVTVGEAQQGLAPYTYHWLSPTSGSATERTYTIASAADVGSYKFKVYAQDDRGCRSLPKEGETTVLGTRLDVVADFVGSHVVCLGSKGKVKVKSVSGGTEPYDYKWFVEGKTDILALAEEYEVGPFDASTPKNYVVEVKERNGSRIGYDTISFTLISAPAPTISSLLAQDTCGQGKIVATATNASVYSWTLLQGTGAVDAKNQNTYNITSLGNYKVCVEVAGNGGASVCKTADTLSGTIFAIPQVTVTPDLKVVARGETVELQATPTPKAGTTISWTNQSYFQELSTDMLIVTTKPLQTDREFVVTAANSQALGCKTSDTASIYILPDPPVLDIDTNTCLTDIKLHWNSLTDVDSIQIHSILWDAYDMKGGGYKLEATVATTANDTSWVEPNMNDTLKFYYARSLRVVPGIGSVASLATSDTVGWNRVELKTGEAGNINYVTYSFDMSSKGVDKASDFIVKKLGTIEAQINRFDALTQLWTSCYYDPGFPPFVPPSWMEDFSFAIGEVYGFNVTSNGTLLFYGKLPPLMRYDLKVYEAGALNPVMLSYDKILLESTKEIAVGIDEKAQVMHWNFEQQLWIATYYDPGFPPFVPAVWMDILHNIKPTMGFLLAVPSDRLNW